MIKEISANLFKIEIPLPLPDSPLKSVNSYVIKAAERSLIVDTGMDKEECLKEMQARLTELGIDLRKTDFFITHMHADHLGLVLNLLADGAKIYFNRKDADGIDFFDRHRDKFMHFAIRNGFPENEVQMLLQNHPGYKYRLRGDFAFTFLKEDERLSVGDYFFRCVETPGHTRGHMCLYETNRKILAAGDHILNGIIPNVQVWSDEWNPLKEYMKSLDKVYQLDIELLLPGHGSDFRNYKERIQELRYHHKKRLGDLSSVLGKRGLTAYQIASRMNWGGTSEGGTSEYNAWEGFPILEKWFATSEAIAQLKYLEGTGEARRQERNQGRVFSLNTSPAKWSTINNYEGVPLRIFENQPNQVLPLTREAKIPPKQSAVKARKRKQKKRRKENTKEKKTEKKRKPLTYKINLCKLFLGPEIS